MNTKFQQYRPSKTLWFWSSAGCVALTMILGFSVGGWTTEGTARDMVTEAREEARAQLAANVCVARFKQSDGFATALADLKAENVWSRDDFVSDGGWVSIGGLEEPVAGAADLCAEMLADMDAPAPTEANAETTEPPKG